MEKNAEVVAPRV